MLEEDESEFGTCDCCCNDYPKSELIACPEHLEELDHNYWRSFEYCKVCCKDFYGNGECEATCEEDFILKHIEYRFRKFCESEGFEKFKDSSFVNSNHTLMISPNKFVDKYETNPIFVESPFFVSNYAVVRHKDTLYVYERETYEYLYGILKKYFKESPYHIIQSEKQSANGRVSLLKLQGNHISGIIFPITPTPEVKEEIRNEFLEYLKDGTITLNMEIEVGEFLQKNVNNKIFHPSIKQNKIVVSKREKEVIRIATVQLDFKLSQSFPFETIDKYKVKEKIYAFLNLANENNVDIICFPELSFCEEWLPDIQKQYKHMIIVAGSYYNSMKNNVCQVLFGTENFESPQLKIKPSIDEEGEYLQKMVPGDCINVYESKFGTFAVLICRDFPVYAPFLRNEVDIIFVPSYNKEAERFFSDATTHVQNCSSYVIISNSAEYGGTSIFGIMNRAYFGELAELGYKEQRDNSYNLCRFKEGYEGMIFADFNVVYKSLQTPTDSNPLHVKKPVANIVRMDL